MPAIDLSFQYVGAAESPKAGLLDILSKMLTIRTDRSLTAATEPVCRWTPRRLHR